MFSTEKLNDVKENEHLEAKSAQGGLPKSIWETYSAFANTDGGTIVLGVREDDDRKLEVVGVANPDKLVADFWNGANNAQTVSANILVNDDVRIETVNEKAVIVINVPRADHTQKPIYIHGDVFAGTYRRNGEGDYHCTREQTLSMLRDSAEGPQDTASVEDLGMEAFCMESVAQYQLVLLNTRKGHPWGNIAANELLARLCAIVRSKRDGELHPTRAGLLMFGYDYCIIREFPRYQLDYREVYSDNRWDNRIVTGLAEWSGNVFDFWRRVSLRITENVPRPFMMKNALYREDDTPMHKAVREGLANMLLHADYHGSNACVAVRRPDKVEFRNPGTLRVPPSVAMRGGMSDPRNPTLATMFSLIEVGERAGSGFDAMRHGCEWAGLPEPDLREHFDVNTTELTMRTDSNAAAGADASTAAANSIGYENISPEDAREAIRSFLVDKSKPVSRFEIEQAAGIGKSRANVLLGEMVRDGIVVREGAARATRYRLA